MSGETEVQREVCSQRADAEGGQQRLPGERQDYQEGREYAYGHSEVVREGRVLKPDGRVLEVICFDWILVYEVSEGGLVVLLYPLSLLERYRIGNTGPNGAVSIRGREDGCVELGRGGAEASPLCLQLRRVLGEGGWFL